MNEHENNDMKAPDADKSAPEAQKSPQARTVALEVTLDGKTEVEQVRFNTAALLARVEKLDDKAEVRVTAAPPDGAEAVVRLFDGLCSSGSVGAGLYGRPYGQTSVARKDGVRWLTEKTRWMM